jgi:glycerate 2-kinase
VARFSLIPHRALISGTGLGARLDAERVAAALARGMHDGGAPWPDVCALAPAPEEALAELLRAVNFDARMREARALVVIERALAERSLAHTVAFELATRARQSGVPAYAVTADNQLNAFDARMLDLQAVLQAKTVPALTAAGRQLGRLIGGGVAR